MFDISPFEWASTHIQLIGWPAVVLAAWKISRMFTKTEDKVTTALEDLKEIHKYSTNHMPHSLEDINENLTGLRDDFRSYFAGNKEK